MSNDALDPVTLFLRSQGVEPRVACFESSDFVIGWRVRMTGFELVYRVEGDQLIVCDFQPTADDGGSNGAVMAFIRFVHRIERAVPQLACVRGMFFESLTNPELTAERQRLVRAYESLGAVWREIDGDAWLVYPMRAGKTKSKAGATVPA